jgi:hypothetical protein
MDSIVVVSGGANYRGDLTGGLQVLDDKVQIKGWSCTITSITDKTYYVVGTFDLIHFFISH